MIGMASQLEDMGEGWVIRQKRELEIRLFCNSSHSQTLAGPMKNSCIPSKDGVSMI